MQAVVLSFDDRLPFCRLVVEAYRDVWPNHPFQFRVPYNDELPDWSYEEVTFIETPREPKETIINLLDGIDEDEFVYWASDDRYPVSVRGSVMDQVLDLVGIAPKWIDEIKLTAHGNKYTGNAFIQMAGVRFRRQYRGAPKGFWMHHFMRSGVLVEQFDSDNWKVINREMTGSVIMPDVSVLLQAEPTKQGGITRNAVSDMRKYGIDIPEFDTQIRRIIYLDDGSIK